MVFLSKGVPEVCIVGHGHGFFVISFLPGWVGFLFHVDVGGRGCRFLIFYVLRLSWSARKSVLYFFYAFYYGKPSGCRKACGVIFLYGNVR